METSKKNLLRTLISDLPTVTYTQVAPLHDLGIQTVADLIKHLPMRHEKHFGRATIEQAKTLLADRDRTSELVTINARVDTVRPCRRRGQRTRIEATIEDETGSMQINWFNQPWVAQKLHPDMQVRFHGSISKYKDTFQMNNPRWEEMDQDIESKLSSLDFLPIYPANEKITSSVIASIIADVLEDSLLEIEDHFSISTIKTLEMPALSEAYKMCHQPSIEIDIENGQRRIAYDELFLLQLGVMMKRYQRRDTMTSPSLKWSKAIRERIEARIPFKLTDAQRRVIKEIATDVTSSTPMNRLLQGDVGSGKTIVALHAMLMAVTSSKQAALMAPTELLAEQHYQTICKLLEGSKVKIGLLSSSLTSSDRTKLVKKIGNGEIHIVIGTHALLTGDVIFENIAIAITDEQHRFGVHQRERFRNKIDDPHTIPHTLVMTATPIPRTLSLTIFGDLDVSTINALPFGRSPITTKLVQPDDAEKPYSYMRKLIDNGQQGYVVVPLVEETESGLKSVSAHAQHLRGGFLKGKIIDVVHGRMKSKEREATMQRFREGLIDVLVATTVIEVGVDVPNATMIIIEHADRFGLAQLHQLRGRVGRSELSGMCVLIASPATDESIQRLNAIVESNDGFSIADRDLEIRGPGELFGSKQSGIAPFRVAKLPRDLELLRMARRNAISLIENDPTLSENLLLRARLMQAHGESLGLGDIA